MLRKRQQQLNAILVIASVLVAAFFIGMTAVHAAIPADYGLTEGDLISAAGSSDPDIYIVNQYGYKRLFLNPTIFNFYGHLKWGNVRTVSAATRDAFVTSGLFRNCEVNSPKVYGAEVTAEDAGTLHWVNVTGEQAIADDPDFFRKVFCINSAEFSWYAKSTDYTAVSQVPRYDRATLPSKLTGKYLHAFHACDPTVTTCTDPRNHKTYVAQSNDGVSWSILSDYVAHAASVPDLIRRGNTLYVYSPGQLRRYHLDTDTWENQVSVSITTSSGAVESFVDPSLMIDENGKIVLFYLVSQIGGDPARCPSSQATCTKYFRSATEVAGSDGASFTVDSGDRTSVFIDGYTITTASDPDIFHDASQYVLYVTLGPSVQVYTSATLRGSYTKVAALPNGMLVSSLGGIPAGHYDTATGRYWTYVHTQENGKSVIRRAAHAALNAPLTASQFTTIVNGSTLGLGASFHVESPGFAFNVP